MTRVGNAEDGGCPHTSPHTHSGKEGVILFPLCAHPNEAGALQGAPCRCPTALTPSLSGPVDPGTIEAGNRIAGFKAKLLVLPIISS